MTRSAGSKCDMTTGNHSPATVADRHPSPSPSIASSSSTSTDQQTDTSSETNQFLAASLPFAGRLVDTLIDSPLLPVDAYFSTPKTGPTSPQSDTSPLVTTPLPGCSPNSKAVASSDLKSHHQHQIHHSFVQGDHHQHCLVVAQQPIAGFHSQYDFISAASPDLVTQGHLPFPLSPGAARTLTPILESNDYPPVLKGCKVAYNVHFPPTTYPLYQQQTPTLVYKLGSPVVLEKRATTMSNEGACARPESVSGQGSTQGTPQLAAASQMPQSAFPPTESFDINTVSCPSAPPMESTRRPPYLRASGDPFVGGAEYNGLTPTPGRNTFDPAGMQVPEHHSSTDENEQDLSLPIIRPPSCVQEASPCQNEFDETEHAYSHGSHAGLGHGVPSARPLYRRSTTNLSVATSNNSRQSSVSSQSGHFRDASATYGHHDHPLLQDCVIQTPPSHYGYQQITLKDGTIMHAAPPFATHGDMRSSSVSLPGLNQLYINTPPSSLPRSASWSQQQRLQPIQTRHLPQPHYIDTHSLSAQQIYTPASGYAVEMPTGRPTSLYGHDLQGNSDYLSHGDGHYYVPFNEHVAYPPHAFQTGPPSHSALHDSISMSSLDRQSGGSMVPLASHTNAFAYQYGPGDDLDMDAPSPSINGAQIEPDEIESHDPKKGEEDNEDELSDQGEPEPEPEIGNTTQPPDTAADEWIPESARKKTRTGGNKSVAPSRKRKVKATPRASPTGKENQKSKPPPALVLEKGSNIDLSRKLPPLMPVEGNLIRYTSLADEKQSDTVKRECFTCSSRDPPSWRKSTLSPTRILCNRCGIYERSHKRPRPLADEEIRALAAASSKKTKTGDKKKTRKAENTAAVNAPNKSRSPFGAHLFNPTGYNSGGHAIYPSYSQENDSRRASAISGLPPGLTDLAGYTSRGVTRTPSSLVSTRHGTPVQDSVPVGGFEHCEMDRQMLNTDQTHYNDMHHLASFANRATPQHLASTEPDIRQQHLSTVTNEHYHDPQDDHH